jgi:hypothetical protein
MHEINSERALAMSHTRLSCIESMRVGLAAALSRTPKLTIAVLPHPQKAEMKTEAVGYRSGNQGHCYVA